MLFDPNWRALRALTLALLLAVGSVGLVACDDPGPAEEAGGEAGEAVDEAVDEGEEAVEEAGDEAEEATD